MLLTGSKDGHVRAWDLATQHCFQMLAGAYGEVRPALPCVPFHANLCGIMLIVAVATWWAQQMLQDTVSPVSLPWAADRPLDMVRRGLGYDSCIAAQNLNTRFTVAAVQVWALDVDPAEERLVVGAADAELHCFRLRTPAAAGGGGASTPGGSRGDLVEAAGCLRRAATERVAALRFDAGGRLLAVQSAGRVLEVFRCAFGVRAVLCRRIYWTNLPALLALQSQQSTGVCSCSGA